MATRTRRLSETDLPQAAREMLRRIRRNGWTVRGVRTDKAGHPYATLIMRGQKPATITWDDQGTAFRLIFADRDLLG